jgi:hypothetical protein
VVPAPFLVPPHSGLDGPGISAVPLNVASGGVM